MGNTFTNGNTTSVNTNTVVQGQPVAVQPAQSRFGLFGGSSNNVRANYAEKASSHLVLREPTLYSLNNLNTVYG